MESIKGLNLITTENADMKYDQAKTNNGFIIAVSKTNPLIYRLYIRTNENTKETEIAWGDVFLSVINLNWKSTYSFSDMIERSIIRGYGFDYYFLTGFDDLKYLVETIEKESKIYW